jgi:hypothetical protein
MFAIMKILIATPAAHGLVTTAYTESLFSLRDALYARGIEHIYRTTSISDLEGSRNVLASNALDENCTHVLFVDSDMGFRPRAVERLIDSGKPVAGAVYARRQLDLVALLRTLTPDEIKRPGWERRAISRHTTFIGDPLETIEVAGGFARFRAVGMGLCLIASTALRTMIERAALTPQSPVTARATYPVYGFFDRITFNGTPMAEDYSFCHRWAGCGGEVWAMVDEPIFHVGSHRFIGSFMEKISGA